MIKTNKKESQKNSTGEQGSKKSQVAIFCLIAILIFYFGTNFLKGIDVFSKKTYYYAVFDNAGGLQESNPVSVKGYKIGKVTKVKLVSDNPIKICAEILVTEPISIPIDSKFEVAPKDLLGGTVVNVIMGASPNYAQNGDTLDSYVVPQMTDGIDVMKEHLSSILASVDTIGLSLKDVLATTGGSDNLKNTLQNLELSTAHLNDILADNKVKVGEFVHNLSNFSKTLEEASPKLNNIIDNFDQIADTIAKSDIALVIQDAAKAINDIEIMIDKVNQGEGSLGQVLHNDTLYKNLEASTNNLNLLLLDLKQNPKKYVNITVFGKKEKQK